MQFIYLLEDPVPYPVPRRLYRLMYTNSALGKTSLSNKHTVDFDCQVLQEKWTLCAALLLGNNPQTQLLNLLPGSL